MSKLITLRLTVERARSLALILCRCGHMENNHFRWDKRPCAHCKCEELKETPIDGVEEVKS